MSGTTGEGAPKTVKVPCGECGGGYRQHEILAEQSRDLGNEEYRAGASYQILKCRGCDTVRFREASWSEDDRDPDTGDMEERATVYPIVHGSGRQAIDSSRFPETVERIYKETVRALNAGAPLLAGGGLRAIVEALCIDQKVAGRNLQQKIDALATSGFLAKPQADLLHEERFLGNSALHELVPPSPAELDAGLEIVETLLKTIYVLPARAKAMRERRNNPESKSSP